MLLIPCPFCGPRSLAEFAFERPIETIVSPSASTEEAVRRLYTRDNPRGPSLELWRHAFGCRAWLQVSRDTASHAILKVDGFPGPAREEGP